MQRLIGASGFEIIYEPGDTVRLIDGNDRVPCTVLSHLKSMPVMNTRQSSDVQFVQPLEFVKGYAVRLNDGAEAFVVPRAIWKEADTGESMTPGKIEHI